MKINFNLRLDDPELDAKLVALAEYISEDGDIPEILRDCAEVIYEARFSVDPEDDDE